MSQGCRHSGQRWDVMVPAATAHSVPGLYGPCAVPRPCPLPAPSTAREPLGHQMKHPKGFQGRRGFIPGFPETVCHPNGGAGTLARMLVERGDEEGCSSAHQTPCPSGLGSPGGVRAPAVPGSRVPLRCCPSQRLSLGLKCLQLPGVLLFVGQAPALPRLPPAPSDAPQRPCPPQVPAAH